MARDKNVNIKIKADSKEAKKGIDKVTQELNKLSKNKALTSMNKLNGSLSLVGKAFSVVTGAVKKTIGTLNDAGAAAAKQAQAEATLEQAAKNNPYLQKENVAQLKEYASKLQNISAVGDEELLPFMAQLAAAGRTQNEIQDIMNAALDVSASGAMSLASAVKNLNKTYSGLSGELGESVPQIKELTKEQLKSGDAVKVIAEQYEGMAKKVADTSGGMKKLSNSWGDFKEKIGGGWQNFTNSFGNAMSTVVDRINTKIDEASKKALSSLEMASIAADLIDNKTSVKELTESLDAAEVSLERLKKIRDAVDTRSKGGLDAADIYAENAVKNNKEVQDLAANYEKLTTSYDSRISQKQAELEQYQKELEYEKRNLLNPGEYESASKNIDELNKKVLNTKDVLAGLKREYLDDMKELFGLSKDASDLELLAIPQSSEDLINWAEKAAKDEYNAYIKEFEKVAGGSKSYLDQQIKKNEQLLEQAEKQLEKKKEEEELNRKRLEQKQKEDDYEKRLNDYISANQDAQKKKIDEIRGKYSAMRKEAAALGKETDPNIRLSEEKEIFDAMSSSFQSLIQNAEGFDLKMTGIENKRLSELKKQQKEVDRLTKNYKVAIPEMPKYDTEDIEKAKEILEDYKDILESMIRNVPESSDAFAKLSTAIGTVNEKIKELGDNAGGAIESLPDKVKKTLDSVLSVIETMNGAISELSSMLVEQAENDKEAKLGSLEEEFDQGLISEEEYNEKKEKIEEEAAQKEYEAKMWAWRANIATATANVAMGIINALANSGSPYTAIPMALAMGAMGAIQLASVIAAKPVPPSFATGGVVGGFNGATSGGDNTYVHARGGEMFLNAKQQRNLFDMANGASSSSGGLKINIQNYMGESAEVSPSLDGETLTLIIDRRVQEQLANGGYNAALSKGESLREGVTITN